MAKTNWQMGDTVQPEDLNQIGQEINDNAEDIADHRSAAVLDHPDGSVTTEKLAEGSVTTEKLADGAVTAAKVAADVAKSADLGAHVSETGGAHGATSAATPNRIVQRDAAGRFKAAAPAASDDVARKAEVDAMLPKSGGVMTGDINSSAADFQIGKTVDTGRTIIKGGSSGSVTNGANIHIEGINYGGAGSGGNVRINLPSGKNLLVNGNKAWHAGNDGAGSGLDADLIRGMDPVRFVFGDNSRATTEYTGNLDDIQKSGFYYAATGHTNSPTGTNGELVHIQRGSSASQAAQIFVPYNSDTLYFRKKNNTWGSWYKHVFFDAGTNKIYASGGYAGVRANASTGSNVEYDAYINGTRRALLTMGESVVELRKYASDGSTIEKRISLSGSNATIDGKTIYHAGNTPIESGTFTPALAGDAGGGVAYNARTGFYTRIGNMVFFDILLSWDAKDSSMSGNAIIAGLPFTPRSDTNRRTAVAMSRLSGISSDSYYPHIGLFIQGGYPRIQLLKARDDQFTYLPVGNVRTSGVLVLSGSYQI